MKETKEAIVAIAALITSGKASLDDGKLGFTDALEFVDDIPKVFVAIQGADQIPSELAEMSDEDMDELEEMVVEKLDGFSGNTIEIVEESLNILLSIRNIVELVK